MEEGGNRTILIIAGIAIVLLVITFGYGIVKFAISKGNTLTNKISENIDSVLESNLTQYDGEQISGSNVLNVIKNLESGSDDVYVKVITLANSGGTFYVCDSSNNRIDTAQERTLLKNARTKTNNNYITPSAYFEGEVIRNANNAIVGIVFTQQ